MVATKPSFHDKEEAATQLTVRKTSLFFAGDVFVAYDSTGNLLFLFDSYGADTGELVLMDAVGRCILTFCRKLIVTVPTEEEGGGDVGGGNTSFLYSNWGKM